jgi:hypothetical protein
MRQGVK